jgi:hypothetical protein
MVGGNPAGLAAAERELGLESTTLAFRPSPFGYPIDEVVWEDGDGRITCELKRWRVLPRVLRDFDVIHFNFGSTIAPLRLPRDAAGAQPRSLAERAYAAVLEQFDLRVLARAGKAIFVTFQGSDARPGPDSAANVYKRRRIACFDRHADGIYALNPDLLRVLPARACFVPYAHVDARDWEAQSGVVAGSAARPLVVHAPTHRAVKGTPFVLEAVARLQAEGLEFDFQLVEGVTQTEARAIYGRADVVVDQLLVGWYGGLAVEAMARSRPTVAFLRDEDLGPLPAEMRAEIPVISAEPQTIEAVLKELLTTRRHELAEIGRRGRDYVARWHDPLRIARRLVLEYEEALSGKRSVTRD